MFIRYAAFHLQQLSAKRQRDNAAIKSIETKEITKEAANETETKEAKRDAKSQVKDKKQKKEDKKEKESAKKEATKDTEDDKEVAKGEKKDDELLLNESYSEIDTDVAKKIVESITDSICSGGDKQESDCKYNLTFHGPRTKIMVLTRSLHAHTLM